MPSSPEYLKWATDADLLREMVGTQGWDRYTEYMADAEQEALEAFIKTPSMANPDFVRGYVQGLRFATTHPIELISRVRTLRAEEARSA